MSAETVKVTLNGKPFELPHMMTLKELVAHLGVDERIVAIGLNEDVIQKEKHAETRVQGGDRVDIVHFVSGG